MTVPRLAAGGLVSFVTTSDTINFLRGYSKRVGLALSAPTAKSVVAGQLFKVDRAGDTLAPLEMMLTFEYLLKAGTTLYDVQTQFDVIYTAFVTKSVGTLTTFAVGNYSQHTTGRARLESLSEGDSEPNFMRLTLGFFLEAGMQG